MSDLPKARLCHLKKWADFEGYGFHLHTMKDAPGQYIGKVDDNSPADSANLKTGDKIIEVNGVNVESENHGEVVRRIKMVTGETKLLVVEPAIYELYKKRGVTISGDGDNVSSHTTADTRAAAAAAKSAATVTGSRLCHLTIKPDFQGYGFNLQAEKGKPGQFIGKVETGSPADAAGLRVGDRLLEINGADVTGETHAQVVQRIKAVPGETRMLVADGESVAAHADKQSRPEEVAAPPAAAAAVVVVAVAADVADDKRDDEQASHLVNGHSDHSERAEVHEAVVAATDHHEEVVHGNEEAHLAAVHSEDGQGEDRPLSDYDSVYVPPAVMAAEVTHDYDNVDVRKDDVSSVGERRDSAKLDEDEQAALGAIDRATDGLLDGQHDVAESERHSDIVDGRRDSHVSHDSKHEPEPIKHEPEPIKHEPEPIKHELEPIKHEPEPIKHEPEPIKHEPEPIKHEPIPEPTIEDPTYSVVSEHTKTAPKVEEPAVPVKKLDSQVSTASNASSSGTVSPGPVTIDGIHFPASATEMRAKMAGKKSRDPRLSSQVSMTEKYKLFEKM